MQAQSPTVLFAIAALISACGSSSVPAPESTSTPPDSVVIEDDMDFPPLTTDQVIVAHRGASGHAPEHTMLAYDIALDMGAEYIEQDVLPTADGVLVVIHDDTLDRTARGPAENCTGRVDEKTLEQLKTCDVGSWFNDANPERASDDFIGLPIPTLEEVFQRYGNAPEIKYYIETKPNQENDDSVERELLRLIVEYGLRDGAVNNRQVLVQSFIPSSLTNMNMLDSEIPLIQLYAAGATVTLAAAAQYAFGVGPNTAETNQQLVDQAHALGLAIHPYTINSREDLEAVAALCVDGLFTNFPDRYRDVLTNNDYGCAAPIR